MSESAPMKTSREDEYSIFFYEVDTKNEVFLPVLWSHMQETAWLVLDLKSRKPQKIEPLFKHLRHLFDPLPTAEEPEKLPAPVQPKSKKSYEVRYSDIDIHHHVNNIKYIEWILDSVPFEMNQTHQIQPFEINFLAEFSYEDAISIQTETLRESPPAFLHCVSREGEGKELCRARAGWKRVNHHERNREEKYPQ